MGVKGLWEEVCKVHPGRHLSLAELNAEHVESTGRPMRVAVDAAIDIYKYKNGTDHVTKGDYGGMNAATRTWFYHVLHLIAAGVQLVYVYDGLGRSAVKRGRCTTAPNYKPYTPAAASALRSEAEKTCEGDYRHMIYLSKMFLGYLGIPTHDAPGEAEAECAALEKAGLVDAVMTSDAFVFGARTILWAQNAKDGVVMVREFKMKDLEAAKPPLTQRVFFFMAILAGGDYSYGLQGCGQNLVFRIGTTSSYSGLLWTLAETTSQREKLLPIWRKRLAEAFRTGVAGQNHTHIADSLSDIFPRSGVIDNYMKEIKKQPTIKTIDWSRDVDLPKLRDFTRVYLDWKYRELRTDGSKWVLAITSNKGTGSAREIRAKLDNGRIVPIDVLAEPIIEGYQGNLKKTEVENSAEWLPHWLVEQACPSLFQRWQEEHARKDKRKSAGEDPSEGTTPKRARGRPPKDRSVTAVQGQSTPKRGPGRPPKPKQHSVAGKPCAPALDRPAARLPLSPMSPNRRATDAMPQKASSAPAYPPMTPNQAKRACATEPRLIASARGPGVSKSNVIDLTDDD